MPLSGSHLLKFPMLGRLGLKLEEALEEMFDFSWWMPQVGCLSGTRLSHCASTGIPLEVPHMFRSRHEPFEVTEATSG